MFRINFLISVEHRNKIPGTSFFIIGNNGKKIHVKGTVEGNILVYSAGDIIIDDDLFYARSPDKFSNSDDYLGLVSERNIEVADPSITGPGDLQVHRLVLAGVADRGITPSKGTIESGTFGSRASTIAPAESSKRRSTSGWRRACRD